VDKHNRDVKIQYVSREEDVGYFGNHGNMCFVKGSFVPRLIQRSRNRTEVDMLHSGMLCDMNSYRVKDSSKYVCFHRMALVRCYKILTENYYRRIRYIVPRESTIRISIPENKLADIYRFMQDNKMGEVLVNVCLRIQYFKAKRSQAAYEDDFPVAYTGDGTGLRI
jgi:hypothetical protein